MNSGRRKNLRDAVLQAMEHTPEQDRMDWPELGERSKPGGLWGFPIVSGQTAILPGEPRKCGS